MDMDNRVVIAGGRGHKGTKWQWKKYKINKTMNGGDQGIYLRLLL